MEHREKGDRPGAPDRHERTRRLPPRRARNAADVERILETYDPVPITDAVARVHALEGLALAQLEAIGAGEGALPACRGGRGAAARKRCEVVRHIDPILGPWPEEPLSVDGRDVLAQC
jgi:hypothetical protein